MSTVTLHGRQACRHSRGTYCWFAGVPGDQTVPLNARRSTGWVAPAAAALLISLAPVPAAHAAATAVDGKALTSAAADRSNWLTHGRTYDEQRFSPLGQINTGNVKNLGLAWFADLDTARGQEATPLVIDGTIYITTAWSKVKAYDAVTGRLRWQYDPKVPGEAGIRACCDVVNRGLAAWGQRLFLGTLDGRLIALDRDSGKPVWSTLTVDRSKPYGITRRAARHRRPGHHRQRRCGDGRARLCRRVRQLRTGRQLWRFYTVPDRPGANPTAPSASVPSQPGRVTGGRSVAAGPCGTRWRTTPSSTCSTSAPATALPGTRPTARPVAATISTSTRSSR